MAKKFSFRLEPLLKLRSHKVSEAQESLSTVLRIRYSKDEAINEKTKYRNELLSKPYKSSKAAELQAIIRHKQLILNEINKLDQERKQIIEIEELRRNKLNKALQNEKVLSKLKDKELESYKTQINSQESNFIDEIAISRYRYQSEAGEEL